MLVCFNALSPDTRAKFQNDEGAFTTFQRIMNHASRRVEFVAEDKTYSVSQINDMIRAQMDNIFGINYAQANRKERRRAYNQHRLELFAMIEDAIIDRRAQGFGDNPFFIQWAQYRNLANGEKNEFIVRDASLLQVSKFAGNHHDIDRQKVLPGKPFTVPTNWYGIKVYADWEEFAFGRIDWADMIDRMTRSADKHRLDAAFTMFQQLKTIAPTDMKLTLNASTTTNQVVEFAEIVKSVSGYDVAFIGTKAALNKLTGMVSYDAWSGNMKDEKNQMGRLGHFEGYSLIEIPRVNAYGTHTEITDNSTILVLPLDPEFKPLLVVDEGDVSYYETGMNRELHDMTVEAELGYEEGIALAANNAFGALEIAL